MRLREIDWPNQVARIFVFLNRQLVLFCSTYHTFCCKTCQEDLRKWFLHKFAFVEKHCIMALTSRNAIFVCNRFTMYISIGSCEARWREAHSHEASSQVIDIVTVLTSFITPPLFCLDIFVNVQNILHSDPHRWVLEDRHSGTKHLTWHGISETQQLSSRGYPQLSLSISIPAMSKFVSPTKD